MKDLSVLDELIFGRVEPHIYAFTTNTVPNYLKVGDTYRAVSKRLEEWRVHYPDLTEQFQTSAKINDDVYFRDFAVHEYLERHNKKRLQEAELAADVYYSREFFRDTTPQDIENAVCDIRADYDSQPHRYSFYNAQNRLPEKIKFKRIENYPMRPNQEATVERFLAARAAGRTHLLMYAVMRFGKSFTSMCCATAMKAQTVVIVSAKADVAIEWQKTVESHVNFEAYDFLTAREIDQIPQKLASGRRVAVFVTLQDLQGKAVKTKHRALFETPLDLLLVDETHFGARAEHYGEVLKDTHYEKDVKDTRAKEDFAESSEAFEIVKTLQADTTIHLSGTPYRILMGGEFSKEDIIAFYQFSDIVKEKEAWEQRNAKKSEQEMKEDWENPYYGFPQMIRFAFNPNESSRRRLEELRQNGTAYAFSALFKPRSVEKDADGLHKQFVYEQDILDLLKVIDGSKEDDELLGFLDYDKIKEGQMCRHMVCVLPYRASCDALEALIRQHADEFKNLSAYEIVNIAGVDDQKAFKNPKAIVKHIRACEEAGRKTLTLTVNRMLTGSTVEQWDTMLYFKDTASAQEYDQATFRLQNQYIKTYQNENGQIIRYNMKPQTLLVDFDPNRLFVMQEQKAQIYNVNTDEAGNSKLQARLEEELHISPVVVMNKNKLEQVKAEQILEKISAYSRTRGVAEETLDIPVDLSLMSYDVVRRAIERENALGSKAGFTIKAVQGEGEQLDFSQILEDAQEPVTEPEHPAEDAAPEKPQSEEADLAKQFRMYYARILFFAFLTKHRVISLHDILACIDEAENARIARNIGIHKTVLTALYEHLDRFMLRKLDYKIQNLNTLSHDDYVDDMQRAAVAVQKFGKLGESEVITPAHICEKMVALIPQDAFEATLQSGHKLLDIAGKAGEFALAICKRYQSLGYQTEQLRDVIYTIPTSGLTYEFTRKVYEILGLNIKNLAAKFSAYDLLRVKNKKEQIDYAKIASLLTQPTAFCEIDLHDGVSPEKGEDRVIFDAVVGNPPYQKKQDKTSDDPIYHYFMDISYEVTRAACLITPAKFLFNAGKTPKDWNRKMLNNEHVRVALFEQDNTKIFPDTDVKGGIAVTYMNKDISFDKIDVFTASEELGTVYRKVVNDPCFVSITTIIHPQTKFNLDALYKEHEECRGQIGSEGRERRLTTNIFKLSIFEETAVNEQYAEIIGLIKNVREKRYIDKRYLDTDHENFNGYKVVVPEANETGAFGETLSNPFVFEPGKGYTQSFLGFGNCATAAQAEAILKYLKTKFARALLGVLKATHHAHKETWKYVPLQDFTAQSDIDWSVSVAEIDRQLYKKYDLTAEEIAFIESKVAPME